MTTLSPNNRMPTNRPHHVSVSMRRVFRTLDCLPAFVSGGGRSAYTFDLVHCMKLPLLCALSISVSLNAAEPSFTFENRPESGIPPEAQNQQSDPATDKREIALPELLEGSLESVLVRYYSSDWDSDDEIEAYLRRLFIDPAIKGWSRQMWSHVVLEPEIECHLRFGKFGRGRLLLWQSVGCIQDASGQWWFIWLADHYHKHHPRAKK
jgi:hypothetical protein